MLSRNAEIEQQELVTGFPCQLRRRIVNPEPWPLRVTENENNIRCLEVILYLHECDIASNEDGWSQQNAYDRTVGAQ